MTDSPLSSAYIDILTRASEHPFTAWLPVAQRACRQLATDGYLKPLGQFQYEITRKGRLLITADSSATIVAERVKLAPIAIEQAEVVDAPLLITDEMLFAHQAVKALVNQKMSQIVNVDSYMADRVNAYHALYLAMDKAIDPEMEGES